MNKGGRVAAAGRRTGRRVGRILAALLSGLVALLVAGLIYQAIAVEVDGRRYRPPGELVDVGSYRMHLDVAGRDRGVRP